MAQTVELVHSKKESKREPENMRKRELESDRENEQKNYSHRSGRIFMGTNVLFKEL
jgi:hypothetical protein